MLSMISQAFQETKKGRPRGANSRLNIGIVTDPGEHSSMEAAPSRVDKDQERVNEVAAHCEAREEMDQGTAVKPKAPRLVINHVICNDAKRIRGGNIASLYSQTTE